MIKVVSVVGTRPEFIKMVPVVKALEQFPDYFQAPARVTSQYWEIPDNPFRITEHRTELHAPRTKPFFSHHSVEVRLDRKIDRNTQVGSKTLIKSSRKDSTPSPLTLPLDGPIPRHTMSYRVKEGLRVAGKNEMCRRDPCGSLSLTLPLLHGFPPVGDPSGLSSGGNVILCADIAKSLHTPVEPVVN